MESRISLITLGVDDLQRSLDFYTRLGFKSDGILGPDDPEGGVAFFELDGGLRLGIWERKNIAKDTGLPQGSLSATDFMLAHNVLSEQAVDAAMAEAEKAGAKILKPAQKAFWGGYTGYFQDPDGHVWEIAYNPAWEVEAL